MFLSEAYIQFKILNKRNSKIINDFIAIVIADLKIINNELDQVEFDISALKFKLKELKDKINSFIAEVDVDIKLHKLLSATIQSLDAQGSCLQNRIVSFPEDRFYSSFRKHPNIHVLALSENQIPGMKSDLKGFCHGFILYLFKMYIINDRDIAKTFSILKSAHNDDSNKKYIIYRPNLQSVKFQYVDEHKKSIVSLGDFSKINTYFRIALSECIPQMELERFCRLATKVIIENSFQEHLYGIHTNSHVMSILKKDKDIYFIDINSFIVKILNPETTLEKFLLDYLKSVNRRLIELHQAPWDKFRLSEIGINRSYGTRKSFTQNIINNTAKLLLTTISIMIAIVLYLLKSVNPYARTAVSLATLNTAFMFYCTYNYLTDLDLIKNKNKTFNLKDITKAELKREDYSLSSSSSAFFPPNNLNKQIVVNKSDKLDFFVPRLKSGVQTR